MYNIECKWHVQHVSVSLCQLNESLKAYDYKHLVWAYFKPTFIWTKVTKLRVRHWILVGSKILMLLLNIKQHRSYFCWNIIFKSLKQISYMMTSYLANHPLPPRHQIIIKLQPPSLPPRWWRNLRMAPKAIEKFLVIINIIKQTDDWIMVVFWWSMSVYVGI